MAAPGRKIGKDGPKNGSAFAKATAGKSGFAKPTADTPIFAKVMGDEAAVTVAAAGRQASDKAGANLYAFGGPMAETAEPRGCQGAGLARGSEVGEG